MDIHGHVWYHTVPYMIALMGEPPENPGGWLVASSVLEDHRTSKVTFTHLLVRTPMITMQYIIPENIKCIVIHRWIQHIPTFQRIPNKAFTSCLPCFFLIWALFPWRNIPAMCISVLEETPKLANIGKHPNVIISSLSIYAVGSHGHQHGSMTDSLNDKLKRNHLQTRPNQLT